MGKVIFPTELRRLMTEKQATQQQIADACGVNQATVHGWLKESIPRGDALLKLAKFFGVSMESLLGVEEIKRRGKVATARFLESMPGPDPENIKEMRQQATIQRLIAAALQESVEAIGHQITKHIKNAEFLERNALTLEKEAEPWQNTQRQSQSQSQ